MLKKYSSEFNPDAPCQCNDLCVGYGDCCMDYGDVCAVKSLDDKGGSIGGPAKCRLQLVYPFSLHLQADFK